LVIEQWVGPIRVCVRSAAAGDSPEALAGELELPAGALERARCQRCTHQLVGAAVSSAA